MRGAGTARSGPVVSVTRTPSKRYGSARALADAFGAPIFEPAWWPEDARAVAYTLERSPSGQTYRIGSTRRDGTPIYLIGRSDDPSARLPDGNWSRLPELEALHGIVRTNGAQVHAVVYEEEQAIHLIGYASEAEVVRAAESLRVVTAW
jgi:hypothetical protein